MRNAKLQYPHQEKAMRVMSLFRFCKYAASFIEMTMSFTAATHNGFSPSCVTDSTDQLLHYSLLQEQMYFGSNMVRG